MTRFIDEKKLPHLLFYGPPGTGKTSTILACARRLYGNNVQSMVLEVRRPDGKQEEGPTELLLTVVIPDAHR